jgi:hypothetical protein
MVCVEVGACGIRLVCLFLNLTGLDRFVAASYGAQQQVNVQVEHAMVTYGQDETARLAKDMPQKDITVTQDETFTGGLCLLTMDPESNFIRNRSRCKTRLAICLVSDVRSRDGNSTSFAVRHMGSHPA